MELLVTNSHRIFEQVRQRALKEKKPGQWHQMNVVLDAVTEVLQQQNQQNTPVAYFGAFRIALEKETKPTHIAATLQLIQITSKHIPEAVFRLKFVPIANLYNRLMNEHERSEIIMKQVLYFI